MRIVPLAYILTVRQFDRALLVEVEVAEIGQSSWIFPRLVMYNQSDDLSVRPAC